MQQSPEKVGIEVVYLKNAKKFGHPEKFHVISLKLEQCGLAIEQYIQKMQPKWQTV